MQTLNNRLNEFLPSTQRPVLVADVSAGLSVGALPGLENFSQGVKPILNKISGLVCSPGQISRVIPLHKGDAGLLVRMVWNNTLRGEDFVLPLVTPHLLTILTAEDALELGACGMVTTILLGYVEEVEAASVRSTVQLALAGRALGLPLVAEVRPTGPRVRLFGKAVELGTSYALEGGADAIVVPYPGAASLKMLGQFLSVPWLLKPTNLKAAQSELAEAMDAGATGLWLDHSLFVLPDPANYLLSLKIIQPVGQSEK